MQINQSILIFLLNMVRTFYKYVQGDGWSEKMYER